MYNVWDDFINIGWNKVPILIFEVFEKEEEIKEMSLKDKVFQNHVEVELRNNIKCIIVGCNIIDSITGKKVESCKNYDDKLKYTMKWDQDEDCDPWDIIKATLNGEVIYDRNEVDWSKVEVDAKILVRNVDKEEWHRRYFCKFENGIVYGFKYGATSYTADDINGISYNQAKLYEN